MIGLFGIQPQDYKLLVMGAVFLVALSGFSWLFLKWLGMEWRTILSKRESHLALKLVAIVLMTLLLILANNALRLPQEMFIYGRF